jgi:outer membrane receptor for ferrienterochelin and colicins
VKYLLSAIALFLFYSLSAQQATLTGTITDGTEYLPSVHVKLKGTDLATVTDIDGKFNIKNIVPGSYTVIVTSVGFLAKEEDVILLAGETKKMDVKLREATELLGDFVVTGTMKETYITESPVKVEVLTKKFLDANVSNNIMEALQTVNGVQEQINCGVCATNDIHINGMEGPYTLVLIDGMPIMSALASVYGFNGIPTSLIEQVEIVKGPSSTLYGTEAVGGVVNIITRSPEKMPVLSFNSYYTTHQESNTDLAFTPKLGEKLTTTISGNFYRNQYRMDFNGDNFTDIPLNERISVFNKWNLKRKDNRIANLAIRYYNEERFGGVMNWDEQYRGSDSIYGESIYTERIEVIGSYQLPIAKEMIRIDYSFNQHEQDSYYGDTWYKADQSVYFANLIWNKPIKRHDLLLGVTNRYQTYTDNSPANSDQERFIPGIFLQDELTLSDKTTLLAGTRFDHHADHGIIISPRLNLKQKFGTYTTMRLNLGTGFRLVNLFTEDHAALSGSRSVSIVSNLEPEESYNSTLNLNHIYTVGESIGTIDVDLFYTYFTNKIVPDYETDPNLIIYDNLTGYGITRGVSASIQHSFIFPFKIKLGGTFQDVYEMAKNDEGEEERIDQIFAPKFSGTFSLEYTMKKLGLAINYTGRVMGPQHLPTYEAPFSRPEISPWYTVQNLQFTKKLPKGLEIYAGIKNLWNFTQPTPLIAPEDPFGANFDTAYAYGPLQVRRLMFGLRWNLARSTSK